MILKVRISNPELAKPVDRVALLQRQSELLSKEETDWETLNEISVLMEEDRKAEEMWQRMGKLVFTLFRQRLAKESISPEEMEISLEVIKQDLKKIN